MAITNKFPYSEMKKVATTEGRRYLTPDGDRVPSVTTILDATKSAESKQAIINWQKSIGIAKATEITTEAASRGTRMHKWIEDFIKTDEIAAPGSNPYSKQSHLMAKQIIENGLVHCDEFWGTEVSLHFPGVYAGTTDLCGIHAGAEAIMDHKQSNRPKKREWIEDYFIQLLFYGTAHNEVFGTNISKGVIFMCTADYVYQEFIIEKDEWKFYENKMWQRLEMYYTQKLKNITG